MAAGGAGGLGAGLWIGGAIGVVGFFGAVGIPIAVLGGFGDIVGNRLGLQFDKKKLEELNREQSECFSCFLRETEKILNV